MPVWKGWDESIVRKNPATTEAKMPGFTPINAPAPASTAAANYSLHFDINDYDIADASDEHRHTSSAVNRDAVQASAIAATIATKPSGKGKKQPVTQTASTGSKRKKTADVVDGMAITKHCGPVPEEPESSPKKATKATTSRSGPKRPAARQRSESGSASQSCQAKPTAISATIALSSVPAPTSLEALKASGRRGAILYSARTPESGDMHDVGFTEPLLRTADPAEQPKRRLVVGFFDDGDSDWDAAFEALATEVDTLKPKTENVTTARPRAQLPAPVPSKTSAEPNAKRQQSARKANHMVIEQIQTEDDFVISGDDYGDEEMTGTAGSTDGSGGIEDLPRRSPSPSPLRDRKLNMRQVAATEDYGGALLTKEERQLLWELKANTGDNVKPIVRSTFPKPVRDRSPIFGAYNTTVLRTCFRVGEAINAGRQAVRNNKDVLLEIYARVTESHRERRNQHFFLHDLYHDKSPYLEGMFRLWDQSQLWDRDSRVFLTPQLRGILCRLIAKMKWDGGAKWALDILSIWEADWEDVNAVAGIYAKENEKILMRDE